MTTPAPYAVFPTQAWTVCQPESGLEHVQPPAAQGAAVLGSYAYIFMFTAQDMAGNGPGQMYYQPILITSSSDPNTSWPLLLYGNPTQIVDGNNVNLWSQAPPTAVSVSSAEQIVIFFSGNGNDDHIYCSWFNGSSFTPYEQVFDNQYVYPGLSPCAAILGNTIFLCWPGSGSNGYFYSVGTASVSDSGVASIEWGSSQVIPGTESWVTSDGADGSPSISAFQTANSSGFIFFAEYFTPSDGLGYMVYDLATDSFTTTSPLGFPWPSSNPPGYTVFSTTLVAQSNLTVPVLIDMDGNIAYYQLNDDAANYGSFSEWLQTPIGGNSGGGTSVAVGIPPSISISEDVDDDPTPIISGFTVAQGSSGGALICGQFYDPLVGDNSVGFAAVAINLETLQAETD